MENHLKTKHSKYSTSLFQKKNQLVFVGQKKRLKPNYVAFKFLTVPLLISKFQNKIPWFTKNLTISKSRDSVCSPSPKHNSINVITDEFKLTLFFLQHLENCEKTNIYATSFAFNVFQEMDCLSFNCNRSLKIVRN